MADFEDEALQQGAENRAVVRDQTYANRPDQYTPFGYSKWTTEMVDGVEKWSQTQGLTPELQNILNKQIAVQGGRTDLAGGLVGRMQDEFGAPIDWGDQSPMGGVPTSQMTLPEQMQRNLDDPTQMRERAEQSLYDKGSSRLTPQFEQKRKAMDIRMRNQGLKPGDVAYDQQMEGLGVQETDAFGQLQMDSVIGGRGEQAQEWNQGLQSGQFFNQAGSTAFNQNLAANQQNFGQAATQSNMANTIRQQQMTEEMTKRGYSLNEINALLSGQQVGTPQMPNFGQAQAAAPAPIYQGAADAASVDAANNPMNAALGAIGTGVGIYAASDRRLKRNIKRIGTKKGRAWYAFDYVWGEAGEGVMSDEIPAEFVSKFCGYDVVDYGRLLAD